MYYSVFRYMPVGYMPVFGRMSQKLRYFCCRHIFKSIGRNVNIERGAFFGNGREIVIGDNSGLGVNCTVPNNIVIGNNVMMGPNCYILNQNHTFDRLDIPMWQQGYTMSKQVIIEDDVWIGRNVTMTPGRHISKGTIIGACCLLCKDFPEYSVIGGNPSKLIKSRK